MGNEQMMGLPIITIGKFTFNIAAVAGIDWTHYEVGSQPRAINLELIGGGGFSFQDEAADAFKVWFDQVTGNSRIQPASLHLT